MSYSPELSEKAIHCARRIAEWLCAIQETERDDNPAAGAFPWIVEENGSESFPNNWNVAFGTMGMLSAFKAFGDPMYERAALNMGRYMKSLQIFDPFKPNYYGAIREMGPQCPWNYTRDTVSVAWSFLDLFRHTGDEEYLERAKIFGDWFLKHGLDDEGWPLWGHQFEPYFVNRSPQMRNDVQGSFQGGSLNFLYRLWQDSGDDKWIGSAFKTMADFFVKHIQQESGFYCTILRDTKQVPPDPQGGLHRTNDDLGSLGLLCAHRILKKAEYLDSIQTYLNACIASQREDGALEGDSVAGIPVVLNILHESGNDLDIDAPNEFASRALDALIANQSDGHKNPRMRGGIVEHIGGDYVCARSSCYALIVMLKLFKGVNGFLAR